MKRIILYILVILSAILSHYLVREYSFLKGYKNGYKDGQGYMIRKEEFPVLKKPPLIIDK
jgi:hypothetical protein